MRPLTRSWCTAVLAGALLLVALGCSKDAGTGLLWLRLSADAANPPVTASSLVLTGAPGGITRIHQATVQLAPNNSIEFQFPGLPASDAPVTFAVRLYGDGGCLVGQNVGPITTVIKAGAQTEHIDVTIAAVAACGDAGTAPSALDGGDVELQADLSADIPIGTGGTLSTGGLAYDAAGGAIGSGGAISGTDVGGAVGSGGTGPIATGGTASGGATAGGAGTGGITTAGGSGGAGGSGVGGTAALGGTGGGGGTGSDCQGTAAKCSSANAIQTCSNGYYGAPVTCTNGACYGPDGSAACCTHACAVGMTCLSASTIQICSKESNGCTALSTSTCPDGACSGSAGSAYCCHNACPLSTVVCQTGASIGTCKTGTDGCTMVDVSACAADTVCKRYTPPVCLNANWADWPMPNSLADVSAGAPNLASYTDNKDGTVTDRITGLMWQQSPPVATYAWAEAKSYCAALALAGYKDWRLPTIVELMSTMAPGLSMPAIDTTALLSAQNISYWSATPLAASATDAWVLISYSGANLNTPTTDKDYVRCVR